MWKHANQSISIALHKIQVQVYQDFILNPETLNLVEEKTEINLEHTGKGDYFLNKTPIV